MRILLLAAMLVLPALAGGASSVLDVLTAEDLKVARKKSQKVASELREALAAEKDGAKRDALTRGLAEERARLREIEDAEQRLKKKPALERLVAEAKTYQLIFSNLITGSPIQVEPSTGRSFDAFSIKENVPFLLVRLGQDSPIEETRFFRMFKNRARCASGEDYKYLLLRDGMLRIDFTCGVTPIQTAATLRTFLRQTLQRAAAMEVPDARLKELADWARVTRVIWETTYRPQGAPIYHTESLLTDRQYRELKL